MRTLTEIQQEYTMVCAQLGDFEVKASRFVEQLEAQRKQLLDKVDQLEAESAKVKEVQAELDKQKAKDEALKDPAASGEVPAAEETKSE